jgi:hypothetical protein
MARFDRDLGLVRYDFEDGGFGMGGPSQEEFLSNIIRPPQPFVQATPQPAAPQSDPVAALFASQEPAAAEVDYFAQQFTPDIFTPTQPAAQPIAQPVAEPAPVYAPFNSSSGIIEDVEEPFNYAQFFNDKTEPAAQPIAQPVAEAAPAYEPFRGLNNIVVEEPLEKFVQDITEPTPLAPTQPAAQPVAESLPFAPSNSKSDIIEDVEEPLEKLVQDITEPTRLTTAQTAQPTQPEQPAKPAEPAPEVLGSLTKQILGSSDTSKWSGSGYGSAEKNAEDMAKIMAGIGITDVKQFGKVDKYEPVEQIGMTFNGQPVRGSGSELYVMDAVDTGDGTDYVRRDLSPEEAQKVKPVYGVTTGLDENNQPTYKNVDVTNVKEKDGQLVGVTGQTFGNKLTGQQVPNTYTERQTGDFFGGTYEGKGNTGYGVQFDAQGNPIFYTKGASSSDFDKFAPLLTLASFVPGLAPFAQGINALISAKQGNVLGAIAGAAGLGNMAGISGMADVAKAARFASAVKSGDPLAIAFSGANLGGVTNIGGVDLKDISKTIGGIKAIQSGDPLTMMLYGMDAMSGSGESSSTKSSADLQTEDPLSPEEQTQLIENRLNSAISRSQISPDEEDANTQRAIEDLERMYGPSSATRSFTPEPQVDEADDFLKSIGIKTVDRPSDSGLSNDDILNMVNANNEMIITGNRDTVGGGMSGDISSNLENAGELPSLTPAEKLSELVVTGDRPKDEMTVQQEPANLNQFLELLEPYKAPAEKLSELVVTGDRPKDEMTVQQEPANIDDFLKLLEPYKAPAEKLSELVITGDRPMPSPDDDFMPTPIDDGGELEIVGNRPPTTSTPAPTTPGVAPAPKAPAKTPTTRAPASRSSNMDLSGLLALLIGQQAPAQQAPMQDPYAHIKLMEDLFGSTIDLTPAGENAARRK